MIGSVIVTLVGSLTMLVKWMLKHFDKQAKLHQQERTEWRAAVTRQLKEHRSERREWHATITNVCKKTNDES